MNEVSVTELLQMVGEKEVEIRLLRQALALREQQVDQLRESLEDRASVQAPSPRAKKTVEPKA